MATAGNGLVNVGFAPGSLNGGVLPREPADLARWEVRNGEGEMVPFSTILSTRWEYGSPRLAGSPVSAIASACIRSYRSCDSVAPP